MHQFILGLDYSAFNTITSQIFNMDPLFVVSNAYATIVKAERHRLVA